LPKSGRAEHTYAQMTVIEELPGISVFYRGAGDDVYHTYSTYQRGLDVLNACCP
jgi:predicted dithiol-disulfide oxidoreductase (DUF899 family)